MKVGIIGRTGSGRGTFFEALTGQQAAPHGSTKTRLAVARVADPRIDRLTGMYRPKKTVFAEVTLALPPNPSAGPLDVASLREMRDLGAYVHVVGCFGAVDPVAQAPREMAELSTEMVLADMERAEKRQANLAKGGQVRPGEKEALERALAQLNEERPLRLLPWDEQARGLLDELGMLSQRPLLTVVNVAEDRAGDAVTDELATAAEGGGGRLLWLCAPLEAEIAALDPEARPEFLEAYGLTQPASLRFVQACLELLDLICFFTVGPDEVRAWPIPRHTAARRAARTIHTDLEKGFIRAEVFAYEVLMQLGTEAAVKAAGKMRMEGKEYEVQDGDIINVRFNV